MYKYYLCLSCVGNPHQNPVSSYRIGYSLFNARLTLGTPSRSICTYMFIFPECQHHLCARILRVLLFYRAECTSTQVCIKGYRAREHFDTNVHYTFLFDIIQLYL